MRLVLVLLAFLLAAGGTAEAQQIDFKSTVRSGEIRLAYRWRDADGRELNTAFSLPRDAVRDAEASFRDFSLESMWPAIEAELRDEVQRFGRGARISFIRHSNALGWSVEAPDNATLAEVNRRLVDRRLAARTRYLARHLRHQVGDMVIIDFAAVARTFKEPLRGLTKALSEEPGGIGDERARVGRALAFFQAIPYDRLEPGQRQGGDFLSAPALLAQNRGDCDSKSAALAAVLQSYVPSRKLAVVTMPGHAILAIDLPPLPGDRLIRTSGRNLVALEVAGPGLWRVGTVAPGTERLLASGPVEVWPLN